MSPLAAPHPCREVGCSALLPIGTDRCGTHRGRITVVCGLQASGKSTYVAQHKQRGDLVWDYDTVITALLDLPSRDRPDECISLMINLRDALVRSLHAAPLERATWIIVTKADFAHEIAAKLGGDVIELKVAEPERQDRLQRRREGARSR